LSGRQPIAVETDLIPWLAWPAPLVALSGLVLFSA
jgi:hypothetical protein